MASVFQICIWATTEDNIKPAPFCVNNILRHYLSNHHVLSSPHTSQQPLSLILNQDSDWPIRGLYGGHMTGIDPSEDFPYWQGVDVNVIFTLKMEEIRKTEAKMNKWKCILHCYGLSLPSHSHICDQSEASIQVTWPVLTNQKTCDFVSSNPVTQWV